MSNMSAPDEGQLFDCIWLVKPMFESVTRTHISIRLETFTGLGTEHKFLILKLSVILSAHRFIDL